MTNKISFVWELAFGHVLQLIGGIIGLLAIWFATVDRIDDNSDKLRHHQAVLVQHEDRMNRMEEKLRNDLEKAEGRITQNIIEVKEDVRWLVRQVQSPDD
jgi:hypothetical protein